MFCFFFLVFVLFCSVWLTAHDTHTARCNADDVAGTVFLWIFWPSFNAALQPDGLQLRAIVNTTLSLSGSVLATFLASYALVHARYLRRLETDSHNHLLTHSSLPPSAPQSLLGL